MDDIIKIIAIVSGVLALIKGLFDLVRQFQDKQSTFSTILSNRRSRIAAGISLIGIIFLAGGLLWTSSLTTFNLTVQIWNIELDQKNSLFQTRQFSVTSGKNIPDKQLKEVADWIIGKIGNKGTNSTETEAAIFIPADFSSDKVNIQFSQSIPYDATIYLVGGSQKSRIPLDESVLVNLGEDFIIEIHPIGYEAKTINVNWGQEFNQTVSFAVKKVSIGIEKFTGTENILDVKIINLLFSANQFSIKGPEALKTLQEKIKEERQNIALNPMAQTSIRNSLEVDYIISGILEKH